MALMAEVRATPAMVPPKPIRVLLYSHDSLGLGHVRRNLALAHALSAQLPDVTGRPVTGLLLTSLDGLADQLPDDFDILALPGVTKRDGAYYPRGMSVPLGPNVDTQSAHSLSTWVERALPLTPQTRPLR